MTSEMEKSLLRLACLARSHSRRFRLGDYPHDMPAALLRDVGSEMVDLLERRLDGWAQAHPTGGGGSGTPGDSRQRARSHRDQPSLG
mgnify:FL=1